MASAQSPDRAGAGPRPGQVSTPGSAALWESSQGRAGSPQTDARGTGVSPAETHHAQLVEGRRWRIEFPAGMRLLSANDRLHYRAKARIVAEIRAQAGWLTKAAKVPQLSRARIDGIYEPPTKHARDRSNWHPTLKAAVDGVVSDVHVLPDDSDAYLDGPHMHIGEIRKPGRFVLVITELLDPSEAPQ